MILLRMRGSLFELMMMAIFILIGLAFHFDRLDQFFLMLAVQFYLF